MAWETQGPIADRSLEKLSYSDRGIVLYRRVAKREIERVANGEDPIPVQRDPEHAIIDTNLLDGIAQQTKSRAPSVPGGIIK